MDFGKDKYTNAKLGDILIYACRRYLRSLAVDNVKQINTRSEVSPKVLELRAMMNERRKRRTEFEKKLYIELLCI